MGRLGDSRRISPVVNISLRVQPGSSPGLVAVGPELLGILAAEAGGLWLPPPAADLRLDLGGPALGQLLGAPALVPVEIKDVIRPDQLGDLDLGRSKAVLADLTLGELD
jgi:hypothetical protein